MATTPTPTPTPTPATGTGKTKKWWIIHVAAGVATVALIAFGMTQCSGKKAERSEKEAKKSELVAANESLDSLRYAMRDARELIGRQTGEIRAKSDTIRMQRDTIDMQRDSIATLNDSLAIVNGKLVDCRNSKRKPTKPAPVKPAPVKPAPVAPVKPDTIIIVQQAPVNPGCAGETNISLNNSQNNGAIVAGGNPGKTDIKLDNGSVNNGAIVVGDGNSVVVNTPAALIAADSLARARQVQNVQFTSVFITRSK